LIIVNRALRPKATDDSKSFHLLTTNPHPVAAATYDATSELKL
jgi:hypothetical protein